MKTARAFFSEANGDEAGDSELKNAPGRGGAMPARALTGTAARGLLIATATALAAFQLLSRIPLLTSRRFDPDELEHAHMAWYVLQGQIPYRDFFEHHTPLFHYALAAFFSFFDVRSADGAFHALFSARLATWGISVGVVLLAFVLARRLRDPLTAWVSLPIVSGGIVLALRAIEIRPDGLSTLFWLGTLISLHAALVNGHPATGRCRRLFAAAGVLIGLGVLTSQKLLVAGPPLAGLVVWFIAGARFGGTRRERTMATAWMAAGVVVPWSIAVMFFLRHGALGSFLDLTIFGGLRWKAESTAASILAFVMQYEPWLFALTMAGCVGLLKQWVEGGQRATTAAVLLVSSAAMFAGLFIVPVPYAQYCLTFMPLFGIVAASFLVDTARTLATPANGPRRRPSVWTVAAGSVVLGLVAAVATRTLVVTPVVYPVLATIAVLTMLALPWHRRVDLALVVVLLFLSVLPLQWTRWMSALGDQGQFAELRYVMDATTPDEIVLDGWSGNGVFRRHAAYYWMLHPGVRAMISPSTVNALVDDLTSGRVRPRVVVLDEHLRELSAELAAFVGDNYEAAGIGDIHVRRGR